MVFAFLNITIFYAIPKEKHKRTLSFTLFIYHQKANFFLGVIT
jgi:hypothetical protein